jgi:hypothetical protein
LRWAVISIFLARVANLRVLWVSSAWLEAGVTVQMTEMRAPFPVRELCTQPYAVSRMKHGLKSGPKQLSIIAPCATFLQSQTLWHSIGMLLIYCMLNQDKTFYLRK